MSGQQFKNASGKGDDEFEAGADAGQVQAASSTSDIDSMLDEMTACSRPTRASSSPGSCRRAASDATGYAPDAGLTR